MVTGASRGIGRAIALTFAKEGYDVIITCSKSVDELESAEKEILSLNTTAQNNLQDISNIQNTLQTSAGPIRCLALRADVSNPDDTVALYKQIHYFTDRLDVVVNNAAISYVGLLTDMSYEEWQRLINVNLSGLFNISKPAISMMLQHKQGSIINISSVWGQTGASCEVAYAASKGGVNTFTKALAQELAPSGIRVNAIACGVIDTEMNAWLPPEDRKALVDEIGLGRLGSPQEIADAAVFLASKKAGYITGQILTVDGGFI